MHSQPLEIVRAVLDKLNSEDWKGAASLADEGSLLALQRQLLWEFGHKPDRERAIEYYWRNSADVSAEVAQQRIESHREFSDPLSRLKEEMPEVTSLEQLHGLSPRDLFAAWLKGQSPRTHLERLVAEGNVSRHRADEAAPSIVRAWDYTLLGTIMDGDRIAHVVYRTSAPPNAWERHRKLLPADATDIEFAFHRDTFDRTHVYVFTCRLSSDGWRLVVDQWHFRRTAFWFGPENEQDAAV